MNSVLQCSAMSFLLKPVYNVLPNPIYSLQWVVDGRLDVCSLQRQTSHPTTHIVSLSCRSRIWRHNRVLKTIAAKLDNQKEKRKAAEHLICKLCESWREEKSSSATAEGTQGTASDWQMAADIHQQMSFPAKIVTRQVIVLWTR